MKAYSKTSNDKNLARQQAQTSQGGNTMNASTNNNSNNVIHTHQVDQPPPGDNAMNGNPTNNASYSRHHNQPSQPHSHANELHGNKSHQDTNVPGGTSDNSNCRERSSSEGKEALPPTNFTPV